MDNYLKKVKGAIRERGFVTKKDAKTVSPRGTYSNWLLDFRKVILNAELLDAVSGLFWGRLKPFSPYQAGGLELAGIPLVTVLVLKAKEKGVLLNGFFIRKSRKKTGLQNIIEGELTDKPVVLVDDIMNSGSSLMRQVELLKSEGKKVSAVCTIIRFRDLEYYQYFNENNISIISLFTLDDFKDSLGVSLLKPKDNIPIARPFQVIWRVQVPDPNYFYVVPKSALVLDERSIYFGSDSGYFWAIDQESGKEIWKFKILSFHSSGKNIFSSPAIYKNLVYFGAYDGNFYALDKETGKKKWIFMEADWIGSSPCVAEDLGLVYVGLEFGLWRKRGGIVALDAETGEKKWGHSFPGLTHGSPAYSKKYGVVVIGSNDGGVYCFKAKSGELLWKLQTGGEVKASFAFDEKRGFVCFGSHDGKLYIVNVKNGAPVHTYDTGIAIYSTPCTWQDKVYFASLNKSVYCLDLKTFQLLWQLETSGRVFASPVIIEGKLYIGSNDARLYEIDPATGEKTGVFQAIERIVNKIAYNPKTKRFFVPTFANEIYCLERKTG